VREDRGVAEADLSVSGMAAATPDSRDRYVDLLRVVALGMVMLGHFLMAGVVRGPGDSLVVFNSLTRLPQAQLLTWIFQVMPVFFVVGGFSHALTWRSVQRRGGGYADFAQIRAHRLLEPTLAFVTVGVLVGVLAEWSGPAPADLTYALRLVGQPLWFIGIYLIVMCLAPWLLRLHDRFGIAVVVALVASVAVVDVVRLNVDVPIVGYLNFVTVWLAIHQLGFFYADGRLGSSVRQCWLWLIGGLVSLIALVALTPYPTSMVSLPGEKVSNLAPPSFAVLALAAFQVGVVLLLRGRGTRFASRPRVWLAVVAGNAVIMTAFLWHLTAIVMANALVVRAGLPTPWPGTLSWWLTRLPLLALVLVILAGFVAVFRRYEVPRGWQIPDPALCRAHRNGFAAVAVVIALLGVLGFSVTGYEGVTRLLTHTLVFLPMTPILNLLLLWFGFAAVGWVARGRAVSSPQPTSRR
jgi:hypothetical protein